MFRKVSLALALAASLVAGSTPAMSALAPGRLGAAGALKTTLIQTPPLLSQSIAPPVGHLSVKHFRKGKYLGGRDLGYGAITNVGVAELAALMAGGLGGGVATSAGVFKFVSSGTGTTSAAATDYQLQTNAATPGCQTGTLTNTSVAGTAQMQVTVTLSYTSTLAITEFGLFDTCTNYPSSTTGTPFTATSGTGGTVTGTPYSTNDHEGYIIVSGATPALGIIASNTSSVITLLPQGWLLASNDATSGSTPGSTQAFTVYPAMLDHKVFSAINVVSGDSIQFQYSLSLASGG